MGCESFYALVHNLIPSLVTHFLKVWPLITQKDSSSFCKVEFLFFMYTSMYIGWVPNKHCLYKCKL